MTGLKAYDVTGQEPMADQVITMERELSLSFCLVLFIFNPFSARGPIYRPPLCLQRMREADVSTHFFQALQ
jgi:hypothetical protein